MPRCRCNLPLACPPPPHRRRLLWHHLCASLPADLPAAAAHQAHRRALGRGRTAARRGGLGNSRNGGRLLGRTAHPLLHCAAWPSPPLPTACAWSHLSSSALQTVTCQRCLASRSTPQRGSSRQPNAAAPPRSSNRRSSSSRSAPGRRWATAARRRWSSSRRSSSSSSPSSSQTALRHPPRAEAACKPLLLIPLTPPSFLLAGDCPACIPPPPPPPPLRQACCNPTFALFYLSQPPLARKPSDCQALLASSPAAQPRLALAPLPGFSSARLSAVPCIALWHARPPSSLSSPRIPPSRLPPKAPPFQAPNTPSSPQADCPYLTSTCRGRA